MVNIEFLDAFQAVSQCFITKFKVQRCSVTVLGLDWSSQEQFKILRSRQTRIKMPRLLLTERADDVTGELL